MAQQISAQDRVIDLMRSLPMCTLEEVRRRCPNLTWNQVFLAVDHLSRTDQISLVPAKGGSYAMTLLQQRGSRTGQHSL